MAYPYGITSLEDVCRLRKVAEEAQSNPSRSLIREIILPGESVMCPLGVIRWGNDQFNRIVIDGVGGNTFDAFFKELDEIEAELLSKNEEA